MKLTTTLLAGATTALATYSPLPTSTPASSVLATVTPLPASIKGDTYTSLASAIYSVDVSYFNADRWSTVMSDMYTAAAKATNSEKVVPSLAMSGWVYPDITAAPWFDKNMPSDDKKYIGEWASARDKASSKFISKDGKDGAKSDASQNKGLVVSAVGLAAVIGLAVAL